MTNSKLVTIPSFAKSIGTSTKLARELVNSGDIPSVQVGKRRRVSAAWIERWTSAGANDSNTRATG